MVATISLRKLLLISFIFVQMVISCKKDERGAVKPPKQDDTAVLESYLTYVPSTKKISLMATAEGRVLPDGSANIRQLTDVGWTHPSVMYFENGWNNYKYWMAITPYPSTINEFENPTIFCSNNGKDWKEPLGILNPIEKAPVNPGYNSDVNLFFENGVMYCFWRGTYIQDPILNKMVDGRSLLYRTSTDGVHWSQKKLINSWNLQGVDLIAPSVLKEADKYYCYGVSTGETMPGTYYTNYAIRKMIHHDIHDFKVDKTKGYELVNVENRPWGQDQEPWHLEVKRFKNLWFMLISTTSNNSYGSGGRLFLGYSKDGTNFKFGNRPLVNVTYAYKSSFELYEGKENKFLNIKLWRASSLGWVIFYDEFSIEGYFGEKV
ncbi:hypothetical protein [Pedobacter arcticus]|uniref:hypothetical protein n=1 Tax=Pedobacter arcticus TaxID=752140 RepID=UPI00037E6775|nr:hypothetical protein [Pedobacter arcticus]